MLRDSLAEALKKEVVVLKKILQNCSEYNVPTTVYKSLNGLVLEHLTNMFIKNSTGNVRELRTT